MNRWVAGARPRTLPAAVVPVVVGTAVASESGTVVSWRAGAALVVSLAIQIGTNYANDYSDGIRGTDDVRTGPVRLVAGGLASPKAVKRAAFLSFAVAAMAGLTLALAVGPELLVVGAACFAAGWYYTGGSKPYGYRGLGEVSVFVFFGLVAVIGSAYVHTQEITRLAFLSAMPIGLLATAMLIVNNLRDIPSDKAAGKRTLAVKVGPRKTSDLYAACILTPFAFVTMISLAHLPALITMLAGVLAFPLVGQVTPKATPAELVEALGATGKLQMAFGALLSLGIVVS